MTWEITFFVNSILLGIGLAMDAFSVSLANGLREPAMRRRKMAGIAGVFAGFQALMPMIGWVCVHTIAQKFHAFEAFIPWIALALLGFIGGSMLISGIRGEQGTSEGAETGSSDLTEGQDAEQAMQETPDAAEKEAATYSEQDKESNTVSKTVRKAGLWTLLVQGVATSIDALSVGFTIADYGFVQALVCALIIAVLTFAICVAGLLLGRKIGTKIGGKAEILGGIILIAIGLEIFITHM